ncbi:hypothetical protein SPBR_09222 [Sporothrix brasiliensis 5110]|uniref:Major facilitator superfamily (MFS) profile domain-containing protein n=1 Tax=Sporothrix brasiliensis 5110 TaxID=1398154 RepID=A0A0C2IXV6_9PEZI|nr:uncharacterized protein SPBR_09222 [Sporothrix brasiliensis 5110]KIH93956.1 hypothetical protein SPBR_09222 [Sporothrix brasiliensis 5110]
MLGTCLIQIVGVVVQVTSTTTAQFIVGRLLVYLAVGFVENAVSTYQSEIAPGALRGFFVGSIQLCLAFGSLMAGLVNNAMACRMAFAYAAINNGVSVVTALFGMDLVYLWMAFAFASAVYVWFVMPELTGRTLEDIDQRFQSIIASWRFAAFETTGLTHAVAAIEQGLAPSKLAGDFDLAQATSVAQTGQMAEEGSEGSEGTEGTPAAPAPTAKGRKDEI